MITRRNFLKTSAAAVAAGIVAPSAWSFPEVENRIIGANDRINVGLIGCRNMGWGDLSDFLLHKEVDCLALCDIDQGILNNRASEVEKKLNHKPQLFSDYRKMLEMKDLDAVIIGTPDHWHCLMFTDACSAGKDVYEEKPIANYIAECDEMVKAAKRYERVTIVGGKFAFPDNCPETFDTQSVIYEFDSFLMHWSHTGGVETGPYNRNYGMAFKGTNGTLVADRNNWEVIPEYDGNKKPRVEATKVVSDDSDHRLHVSNFIECMKTRTFDTACTIENGSLCAKYAHLGNIAARSGLSLVYDDQKHTFTTGKEANSYLMPKYRSPWKFPNY